MIRIADADKMCFQGTWEAMAREVAANRIDIGKYNPFRRTIEMTHKDGTVQKFTTFYFSRLEAELTVHGTSEKERIFRTYVKGVAESADSKIVSLCIYPLSSILPDRPWLIIKKTSTSPENAIQEDELVPWSGPAASSLAEPYALSASRTAAQLQKASQGDGS